MRINPWMLAGLAAPLVYAGAVVAGGWLTPGYSHVAGPVSALIMSGAPAVWLLNPLFTVYNVLIVVFALGLRGAFRERGVSLGLIAPALLALTGLTGIAILFYSMDPIGARLSSEGAMHIGLSAVASVATILTVLTLGLSLRGETRWRPFANYSLATLIVIVFSGGFTALAVARLSPVMGLWERMTIGAFLQWVLVLALILLRRGG